MNGGAINCCRLHEREQFPRGLKIHVTFLLQFDAATTANFKAAHVRRPKLPDAHQHPQREHTVGELLRRHRYNQGMKFVCMPKKRPCKLQLLKK